MSALCSSSRAALGSKATSRASKQVISVRPFSSVTHSVPGVYHRASTSSRQDVQGRLLSTVIVRSASTPVTSEDDVVRLATIGDTVTVHFVCKTVEGEVLESTYESNEPISFELGSGDIMGNNLFKGFDEAIRGMAVGQATVLEASGGEWRKELMFVVPTAHPEVERLQGRYKNQGGLQKNMLVELANGAIAIVVDMNDESVTLDANSMMAGKTLIFELELLAVDKPVLVEE